MDELERAGIIKRLPIDEKKVSDALDLAKRDLKAARNMMGENCDWAFSIAYNSMLQSARALMFSKGWGRYRGRKLKMHCQERKSSFGKSRRL
ncbi:MAG: HEPN domain-containing protein [Euryarchaeota archaeon]|nr:HEPN domain-containing protein [Euryarchaeota archaeon]